MPTEDEQYKKDMEAAGVEIPEDPNQKKDEAEKPETPPEKKVDEKPAEAEKPKEGEDDEADDGEKGEKPAKPEKKRSIYDEYKDKKHEARTEKERADTAEKELVEVKKQLENLGKAKDGTKDEKKEALDEFDEFAKKYEGDPEALRALRDLILQGVKPDTAMKDQLAEFQEWKKENQKSIDDANFETEFKANAEPLKELFPTANAKEMDAIKDEIKKLAHTKGWNDKSLGYIAFEHKKQLSALVSPRKKGTESRDNNGEDVENVETEFNPSPDFSKMSAKEYDAWEKKYKEISRSPDGLTVGANGKKSIT